MEKYIFGFRQTFTFKLQELVSASHVSAVPLVFLDVYVGGVKTEPSQSFQNGGGIYTVYRLKLSLSIDFS